jgi:uncharacterized RDD family membrane protein YckC
MTEQPATGWQAPAEEPGPAPGYAFGGFGARLLAYIIDVLIVGAAITVLLLVVAVPIGLSAAGSRSVTGAQGGFIGLVILIILVISLGYFPWFWSRSGATPGMSTMGLRVVRDADGGKLTVGQAIIRLIGYWVSGFVLYLGFIWIFIDSRRRGWHDLIAGTVVVKQR